MLNNCPTYLITAHHFDEEKWNWQLEQLELTSRDANISCGVLETGWNARRRRAYEINANNAPNAVITGILARNYIFSCMNH